MTVGERIKEVRISRNMSQEELATKMGYKGRSSISKIEKSSDKNLSLEIIQDIANILHCSPLYLMGWDNSDKYIDTKLNKFESDYSKLNESDKQIIDKMIESLLSKQG